MPIAVIYGYVLPQQWYQLSDQEFNMHFRSVSNGRIVFIVNTTSWVLIEWCFVCTLWLYSRSENLFVIT